MWIHTAFLNVCVCVCVCTSDTCAACSCVTYKTKALQQSMTSNRYVPLAAHSNILAPPLHSCGAAVQNPPLTGSSDVLTSWRGTHSSTQMAIVQRMNCQQWETKRKSLSGPQLEAAPSCFTSRKTPNCSKIKPT